MSIDDIKNQLGTYDDWDPWQTVRYNLFELKEHIIHAALLLDGGLQSDEIEDEFENNTPWTTVEPLEWVVAHIVTAVGDWLDFHNESFVFGLGPSFGPIPFGGASYIERVLRCIEDDLNRAVDLLITSPLWGKDLELFAGVLEAHALLVSSCYSLTTSPVLDPRQRLRQAELEAKTRTPEFEAFQSWIKAASVFLEESVRDDFADIEFLRGFCTEFIRQTGSKTESDATDYLKTILEIARLERFVNASEPVSPIVPDGKRGFSVLSQRAELRVPTVHLEPKLCPNNRCRIVHEILNEKLAILEKKVLAPLRHEIDEVLKHLTDRGLTPSMLPRNSRFEDEWVYRSEMFELFQSIGYNNFAPDVLGGLQYVAVALLSPRSIEISLQLLPPDLPLWRCPSAELSDQPEFVALNTGSGLVRERSVLRNAFQLRVDVLGIQKLHSLVKDQDLHIDTEGIDTLPSSSLVMQTFFDGLEQVFIRWSKSAKREIDLGIQRMEYPYFHLNALPEAFWNTLNEFEVALQTFIGSR
jgi:hypothetical protein